jgi:hypothetical protein
MALGIHGQRPFLGLFDHIHTSSHTDSLRDGRERAVEVKVSK